MPGYVDTPMVHSQKHRAASLENLGVNLTADQIADVVWRAAHANRLHHVPQRNVRLMGGVAGLVPELGRRIMLRMARRR